MSRDIVQGSTDQATRVRVLDGTTALPDETAAFDSAGIALWYCRDGGAEVAITPITKATPDASHADGGFVHINDGYCHLDLPDAAVAAGSTGVLVGGTITGKVIQGAYHSLVTGTVTLAAGTHTDAVIPTVTNVTTKTGYSLASTGLDSIPATAPGGVATTFPQMIVQTWRRLFKKSTLSATTLTTYADDGTTPETEQTVSDVAGTETVGDAS